MLAGIQALVIMMSDNQFEVDVRAEVEIQQLSYQLDGIKRRQLGGQRLWW